MDQTETNPIETNPPSFIRKKSSFLRDGSYRIFHIAQQPNEDSGDDDEKRKKTLNIDEASNKLELRPAKITSTNSLNQLFYLHTTSCETTSTIETKVSSSSYPSITELSQSAICADAPSGNFSEKNTRESVGVWTKGQVLDETNGRHKSLARTSKFESPSRKQVLIHAHPELQASFHRRRQRFLVACGTVTVALSVIVTITVYVIVMTVKYIAQMNQLAVYRYPRI